MKRKTTIKFTPFNEWDQQSTNCQICNKVKLLQKRIIGTEKLKTQKSLWVEPRQALISGHNLP